MRTVTAQAVDFVGVLQKVYICLPLLLMSASQATGFIFRNAHSGKVHTGTDFLPVHLSFIGIHDGASSMAKFDQPRGIDMNLEGTFFAVAGDKHNYRLSVPELS